MITIFFFYKREKRKFSLVLVLYYFITTALLLLACLWVKLKDRLWIKMSSNILLYDVVALLTPLFIGLYYYHLLKGRTQKKITVLLILCNVAYFAFYNLTLTSPRIFDSVGYSFICASITICVFMYFRQLLNNVSERNILLEFNFWLSSGYLLYFLGGFVIFISYHYLTVDYLEKLNTLGDAAAKPDRKLLTKLWGVHNVLLTVSALSLTYGISWITSRNKSA